MKKFLFHTILFLALITTSAHAGTQVYENTLSSGDKHKITANITASSAQFSIEVSHPTDPITPSTASLKVCKEKDGTNCRSPYVYEETVVVPAGGSINSQTLGKVKNLSIGQDYYFQYADWAVEKFTTEKALDPNGTTDLEKDQYRLLAPFPGMTVLMDPVTCKQQKDTGQVGKNAICDVNGLLNFAFKLMIGITAVVLILRLMYEGYTYIVTDVPYLKTNAKSGFTTALLGLLLALSAYVILNTINPKLVSNTINIQGLNVEVKEFVVTGALTGSFDGKPVKINFNKKAYPAAKIASSKTGVNEAFILAIFAQETGSGANLGTCSWDKPGVMREDNTRKDKTAFSTIMSELGIPPSSKSVSCPYGGGWGGAIGYTQFLPTTWLEQRNEARTHLGHMPNPWVVEDAIMVSAVYLKKLQGANKDERNAACKYYSGSKCTPGRNPANEFYGDEVMAKKKSLEEQIKKAKEKGEIQ